MDLGDCFTTLLAGGVLAEADAEALFEAILEGRLDPPQIGAVLALIQARGAETDELVGAARAMRRRVTPVPVPPPPAGLRQTVLDTCGTGGALKTFNISTAVAIVTAAASPHHQGGEVRILVAKHGNRSRTGRGSAEVLAALGVNVDAGPEAQARCLDEAGVCFCFAVHHHPAMKHAGAVRRALPFPTIFNLLGPLTNPAGAPRQVLGVFEERYVPRLGEALQRLGTESAMVVHGAGGMDEISTLGPTTVCRADRAGTRRERIDPRDLGISPPPLESLCVRTVEEAAERIRAVLRGERGPSRDIVAVNAGAALLVAGVVPDLASGIERAGEAIECGGADAALRALARASAR
jgi:anthranilate phosphoribosyltransferase